MQGMAPEVVLAPKLIGKKTLFIWCRRKGTVSAGLRAGFIIHIQIDCWRPAYRTWPISAWTTRTRC
jgi:hypothetical protein